MTNHVHIYRAIPGAGWRCIHCSRWTVTPPPPEQRASYQERLAAEKRLAEKGKP